MKKKNKQEKPRNIEKIFYNFQISITFQAKWKTIVILMEFSLFGHI